LLVTLTNKKGKKMKRLPIRIYDNGQDDNATLDQFTVVFTKPVVTAWGGRLSYSYLGMSVNPFDPQGFGQHGESWDQPIDKPQWRHLGRKIKFEDLPADCQKAVLNDLKGE
jgi:hypothetical protein